MAVQSPQTNSPEQHEPSGSSRTAPLAGAKRQRANVNYWNYRQTGVRSRPLKLLKHPIEHIERKILVTYLLSFLFKLIAILTGPLIVLAVYLITVPFTLSRLLVWNLLNLSWTCNAKIRTHLANHSDWSYCPLSHIEAYWFGERQVNNVLLVLDNRQQRFSVARFRRLVSENILANAAFRRFSARVVARGVPFYRSYYWHHLEFTGADRADEPGTPPADSLHLAANSSSSSSLQTVVDRFSVTSIVSQIDSSCPEQVRASRKQSDTNSANLSEHIFVDSSLAEVSAASVRRHLHGLLRLGLNPNRPLWELRVLPSRPEARTYLIFRCHQSLADGRGLSKILTDCLSEPSKAPEQGCTGAAGGVSEPELEAEEDETELRRIPEKASFVARMSRSDGWRSAIFVGPLTVMLWVVWTFTRRKHNHLNKCRADDARQSQLDSRRFYLADYSLTKFHQIKQMTRSTVSDIILCALSGALRDYLRGYNGVTNPPNLNVSLLVDMHQSGEPARRSQSPSRRQPNAGGLTHRSPSSGSPSSSQTGGPAREDPGRLAGLIGASERRLECALVNVPLPTSVAGAVPRLWDVRNTMDELRTSADPWVMLGLQRFLFALLPVAWYQRLVNCIALRNSSSLVSSLQGPENKVEAWCVDLVQRALSESQRPACAIEPQSITDEQPVWWPERALADREPEGAGQSRRKRRRIAQKRAAKLKLLCQLGSVSAIYYCLQSPTSNIPISFNCISFQNKLFISSLTNSILVEDSKLLMRLFFRQLDQLANTIAKRRSLLTLIRMPAQVEINCQPASPLAGDQFSMLAGRHSAPAEREQTIGRDSAADEEQETREDRAQVSGEALPTSRLPSGSGHKDDIEANIVDGGRAHRCLTCDQSVCVCRRRKSLFNFDYNKQRAVNLLSLLHPAHFIGMRTSKSQESGRVGDGDGDQVGRSTDCACGRTLLRELDEEDKVAAARHEESASRSQSGESDLGEIKQQLSGGQVRCAKCRLLRAQSSLSLNSPADRKANWTSQMRGNRSLGSEQSIKQSDPSNDSKRSNQLMALNSKQHSRSETDLLPIARGSKLLSCRVKRQRSIVVVKDEVNADVNLRYQLEGQSLLGIRNRRFSTIGNPAIGTQRRASLIPFGLMQNNSLSKLFKDDAEAHV